jgi:CubicO group peptidase (beta-lactamase class C family)
MGGDDLARRVEAVLDDRARRYAGIVVGVHRDGRTFTAGRGKIADDRAEAPDERTIFEIGSITKVFTGTLLADLAQAGLVSLDDPVQKHLPPGVVLPQRGRPITLADLATHTSGLPRLPGGLLRSALTRERDDPYAGFDRDRLEAAIAATKPRRAPGRKLRYSNYGAGLLGYVLSRRVGTAYADLVAERITGPLGMHDTSIEVPESKRARFAQGHTRRGRAVPYWNLAELAGAGGLRSTVADLLVFLRAQLGAAPPSLAESLRLTRRSRASRGALSIGLGWLLLPVPGQAGTVVWHDGGTGGFRSVAGLVEGTRTGVVVLASSARPVDNLGLEILKAISPPAVDRSGSRSS